MTVILLVLTWMQFWKLLSSKSMLVNLMTQSRWGSSRLPKRCFKGHQRLPKDLKDCRLFSRIGPSSDLYCNRVRKANTWQISQLKVHFQHQWLSNNQKFDFGPNLGKSREWWHCFFEFVSWITAVVYKKTFSMSLSSRQRLVLYDHTLQP